MSARTFNPQRKADRITHVPACAWCGLPFVSKRSNATKCGGNCRSASAKAARRSGVPSDPVRAAQARAIWARRREGGHALIPDAAPFDWRVREVEL